MMLSCKNYITYLLTKGKLLTGSSRAFLGTFGELGHPYTHPTEKQCNYSVDTSAFATSAELEELRSNFNEFMASTDSAVYSTEPCYTLDATKTISGYYYPGKGDAYSGKFIDITLPKEVYSVYVKYTGSCTGGENGSSCSLYDNISGIGIGQVYESTSGSVIKFKMKTSSISIYGNMTCGGTIGQGYRLEGTLKSFLVYLPVDAV